MLNICHGSYQVSTAYDQTSGPYMQNCLFSCSGICKVKPSHGQLMQRPPNWGKPWRNRSRLYRPFQFCLKAGLLGATLTNCLPIRFRSLGAEHASPNEASLHFHSVFAPPACPPGRGMELQSSIRGENPDNLAGQKCKNQVSADCFRTRPVLVPGIAKFLKDGALLGDRESASW